MKNLMLSDSLMDKLNQIMQQLSNVYPKAELERVNTIAFSAGHCRGCSGTCEGTCEGNCDGTSSCPCSVIVFFASRNRDTSHL